MYTRDCMSQKRPLLLSQIAMLIETDVLKIVVSVVNMDGLSERKRLLLPVLGPKLNFTKPRKLGKTKSTFAHCFKQ